MHFYSLALVLLSILITPAFSYSQDLETEVARLKERLLTQSEISRRDVEVIEPELRDFARKDVRPDAIEDMARESVDNNCHDYCLLGMLNILNDAISRGIEASQAQTLVSEGLRDEIASMDVRTLNDPTLPSRVRERVEDEIKARLEVRPEGGSPEVLPPSQKRSMER